MSSTLPITSFLIDQWAIEGKQVSLFRRENETVADLEFTVEEGGHQICKGKIGTHLYENIRRTSAIVNLFHEVINVNLLSRIEPSSFLPVLETHACANKAGEFAPLAHLRVALFGLGDPKTEVIHEARWGVFDDSDRSCRIFEIQKIEGAIKECLLNILCYRLNVASYTGRLRIEATLDSHKKVESLALVILNRVSLFSKNVFLDEERWAITLVSAQPGTESSKWRSGHAMIACEGVKDEYQFFKYLHISTNNPDQNCFQAQIQAQIKIKKEFIPNTLNSPTWVRPRTAVENMLYSIQEADRCHINVPFAIGRKIPELATPVLLTIGLGFLVITAYCAKYDFSVFSSKISSTLPEGVGIIARYQNVHKSRLLAYSSLVTEQSIPFSLVAFGGLGAYFFSDKLAKRYDCLYWALERLSEAGVEVELPLTILTPNAAVQFLNEHPKIST